MNRTWRALSSSMLRSFARLMVRVYYDRIEVSGRELIPKSGSVLLCANHPNSLLDPVMLGLASKRPVKFLAKAPLFKKPVLGAVMNALGMIPAGLPRSARAVVSTHVSIQAANSRVICGSPVRCQ